MYEVLCRHVCTATTNHNGGTDRRPPPTTQQPDPLTEHGGSHSAVPATNSAHGGSQSAVPATKSAHGGHKVLCLPRNLHMEETSEISNHNGGTDRRPPQTTADNATARASNGAWRFTKCCACHEFCTWRFTKCCACHVRCMWSLCVCLCLCDLGACCLCLCCLGVCCLCLCCLGVCCLGVCGGGGGGQRTGSGMRHRKEEPHTKMWGKRHMLESQTLVHWCTRQQTASARPSGHLCQWSLDS